MVSHIRNLAEVVVVCDRSTVWKLLGTADSARYPLIFPVDFQ